jgi:dihydrofolate reductase
MPECGDDSPISRESMFSSEYPLHMVVAVADNHVMGLGDALPWKLSSDLQRFKRLTMGHAMLMGRRTFESIGRVLPGRTTIVLSRRTDFFVEGGMVASDIDTALASMPSATVPFLVGGAEVYRAAWSRVGVLHITRVRAKVPGDTFLDPLDLEHFQRIEQEHVPADSKNDWPSDYECWVRQE